MTAKQILDAFSESLMRDERILSPREWELLTNLLQNSRAVSNNNPEIQCAVTAAIARSVGETVAQRAFALLGGSIVEQIVAHHGMASARDEAMPAITQQGPHPPAPQPPGPHVVPKGPHPPAPQPPGPKPTAPQPPGRALQPFTVERGTESIRDSGDGSVGVMEAPPAARAQYVVLDEFLAPQELDELIRYALQNESGFTSSEVVSPSGVPGVVDYDHRRSRVLMDLGPHEEIVLHRIRGVLPSVRERLGIEEFPIAQVEAQITASNDGDFFRAHCDDAQALIASRRMTFVYFFHREPRRFEGGELRLYDSNWKGQPIPNNAYQTIVPQQNQIVFFPCSLLHEITPVDCPSRAFADSRFTLNGWLHR